MPTPGVVVVPVTAELPDRGNQPDISRVPALVSTSTIVRNPTTSATKSLRPSQVPHRSGIALHKAQLAPRHQGMPTVRDPDHRGTLDGEAAVFCQSGEAFALADGALCERGPFHAHGG